MIRLVLVLRSVLLLITALVCELMQLAGRGALPHPGCNIGADAWLVQRPQVCSSAGHQRVAPVEAAPWQVRRCAVSAAAHAVCGHAEALRASCKQYCRPAANVHNVKFSYVK